jgi:adenine-specific DNA-methyltransferase
MAEKLEMMSSNIIQENIDYITKKFPNALKEVMEYGKLVKKIDFDVLKQELSTVVIDDKQERYQMTWPDKKKSVLLANSRVNATLRPIKEKSVDFDNTQNLYIEGDNLDVLKLLRETYLGKIKMIYIDPPYNTGNDFVYEDDFSQNIEEYLENSGQFDDQGNRLFQNTDSNGRFHTDWLNMMYPRLKIAKDFLHDSGVILVSIGDSELANTIKIMDEIYGPSNQVCVFAWKSRAKPTNAGNSKFRPQKVSEYIVVYGKKNPDQLLHNVIPSKQRTYPYEDKYGKYRLTTILTSNRGTFRRETMRFESNGYKPDEDFRWKAGKATIDGMFESNHIQFNDEGTPMEKKYVHEESDPLYPIYTFIDSDLSGTAENGKADLSNIIGNQHGFDTVKPVQLMKYLVSTFSNENDIILDFFSGTATTAHAVMEINTESAKKRNYIMVQINEKIDTKSEAIEAGFKTICDIALVRITKLRKKMTDEFDLFLQKPDLGVRVFKLDSSNMNDVYYNPNQLNQNMLDQLVGNVKEDRSPLDLLFQIMLELGIELSAKIEEKELLGKKYFVVNENDIVACFDDGINDELVKELAKIHSLYAVFKDSAFASDSANINCEQIIKSISPSTTIKVV